MYKSLSIILFSLVLGSCVSKKQVTSTTESDKVTTGYKTEKYRDTVFHTQKVSTTFGIPIPRFTDCPEPQTAPDQVKSQSALPAKTYTQQNGNARANVRIERDSIFITAECDSIALRAQIKAEYEGQFQQETTTSVKESETKKGTGFFGGLGIVIAALVVGFVLGKLIRI